MTNRLRRLAILLGILCALTPANAMASEGDEAAAPAVIAKKSEPPAKLGRLDSAPVIDGRLDDEVWSQAVVLKDFLQVQPGDNIEPSQRTEVLLGHDGKTLFIAFRCFDNEPDKIRATIPKRDQIFDDDYVGIHLDTFND